MKMSTIWKENAPISVKWRKFGSHFATFFLLLFTGMNSPWVEVGIYKRKILRSKEKYQPRNKHKHKQEINIQEKEKKHAFDQEKVYSRKKKFSTKKKTGFKILLVFFL